MTAAVWLTVHDWSAVVSVLDAGVPIGILAVALAGVWDLSRGR